jgi:hypothetical protein
MMATPGTAQMYQALRIRVRPSPIRPPQLETLGSPRPRNDTADSNSTAPAITSEDSTMTGGSALGRISPNMMRRLPMPMERQAWTNSRSRSDMNSARVNRAIGVQVTIPTAMVTYSIFCPRIETMVRTKIRFGMVWNSSVSRIRISSTQPPK